MNLNKLFYYRMKGLNAVEIAKKLNLHPVTVRDKLRELKNMDEISFKKLVKETLRYSI